METAYSEIPEAYKVIEGFPLEGIRPLPKHVLVRWMSKKETKAGVLIPQNRERAHLMRGQVLAVGPECDQKLEPGQEIAFDGLTEKEWLGPQSPPDRDTCFFFRVENVYAVVRRVYGKAPEMDMVGSWILVRPDPSAGEKSGLMLANLDGGERKRTRGAWTGEALSVGSEAGSCVKGDMVVYETRFAKDFQVGDFDGEICVVVTDEDVVGIKETE